MIDFAQEAGVLALALRASGLEVTQKGDDLSQALTQADQAISAMMAERFGPRIIEEETADSLGRDQCRAMLAGSDWSFIGDPIDGTQPFSGGLSAWGTMIAACRKGWPLAGVMSLPAWVDERDKLDRPPVEGEPRGIILASAGGKVWWAPTLAGRLRAPLAPLRRSETLTRHVGWLPLPAKYFTLDYKQGFFPHSESASVSDFASLVIGRLDATTFNAAIWDIAAAVPAFEAFGFRLFAWPDLQPSPANLMDMFNQNFYSGDRLWLIARDEHQAAGLARAIKRGH